MHLRLLNKSTPSPDISQSITWPRALQMPKTKLCKTSTVIQEEVQVATPSTLACQSDLHDLSTHAVSLQRQSPVPSPSTTTHTPRV